MQALIFTFRSGRPHDETTALWDVVSSTTEGFDATQTRKKELEEYWREFFHAKSMVSPHLSNTPAWEIVNPLLDKSHHTLRIQTEHLDRELEWTEAAEYLSLGLLDPRSDGSWLRVQQGHTQNEKKSC